MRPICQWVAPPLLCAALAISALAPAMGAPAGRMTALAFFDGKWRCTSGPIAQPTRDRALLTYDWDADGLIQRAAMDFVNVRTGRRSYIRYYVTYDNKHQRFASGNIEAGSDGGATMSHGWVGNTMSWVGDPDDGSGGRYDFIRRSATSFDVAYSEIVEHHRKQLGITQCKR